MPGILVVDDEPAIRTLLAEALRAAAHEVVLASTAAEAVDAARQGGIAVALVDKNLPDGSGLELIGELKMLLPDSEMILITAYASLDSAIEAISLGAFDYVRKPFDDLSALNEKVANALRRNRLAVGKKLVYKHLLESEETFREVFQSSPDAMIVFDGDRRIVDANDAATRLYGYSADEFRALRAENLSPTALGGERRGGAYLRWDCRKDGSGFFVEVSCGTIAVAGRTEEIEVLRNVSFDVLDVNEVVREIEPLLVQIVGDRASLATALATGPCRVRMRRAHLEQVLLELAMSVREAGWSGGRVAVITERLAPQPGTEPQVLLTFAHAPADRAAAAGAPGQTLRLAMVREVLRQSEGRLSVAATGSGGTTYLVALPCAGPQEQERER